MNALADNQKPRILISRVSAHGDVIQTLPLLSDLKRHWPEAYVGWLVEASAVPLLEDHPLIDRLHVSHRKQWLSQLKNPLKWVQIFQEVFTLVAELRNQRYEIALDVQGLLKSAVWLPLAGIPKRYGFEATREQAAIFYTHKLPFHDLKNPNIPAVEKFRSFAEAIGVPLSQPPVFAIPPTQLASQQKIETFLGAMTERPVIALAPFTQWRSKTWPYQYWCDLIQKLLTETNAVLLMLGAPGDIKLAEQILAGLNSSERIWNLTGKTNWQDLYALFKRVDVLVGLDSAPVHIANAVGYPHIVGIFGPTGPRRTGPIGMQHITVATSLDCQPCFERRCPLKTDACMNQLMPELVLNAIGRQLNKLEPGKRQAHLL